MKEINLAVVGATGLVGETILKVLEERDFPIRDLYLLASARSKGKTVKFKGKDYIVEELTEEAFKNKNIDIAMFAAGGSISEKFAHIANEQGIIVVDNSSFFRMDPEIPLVIPEVNPEEVKSAKIIANPNCSTIQSIVALKPLYDKYGIKRIIYNTYQAVSGSGIAGIEDLEEDKAENYPYHIKNNILPHIDDFIENRYTKEEMKMIDETRKLLKEEKLPITATTVRVPIKNTHAVSINVELEEDFDLADIFELLKNAPGIVLEDNLEENIYPIREVVDGADEVYIGRIRKDYSVENGLNLWCVADNIRKGAATNAVQIAELVAEELIREEI